MALVDVAIIRTEEFIRVQRCKSIKWFEFVFSGDDSFFIG